MPTFGASLRRIARINKLHGNTEDLRLVGYVLHQLGETPVVMPRSLGLANRSPLGNTGEVLQSNTKVVPSGLRDKSFTDTVVNILLESRLAPR